MSCPGFSRSSLCSSASRGRAKLLKKHCTRSVRRMPATEGRILFAVKLNACCSLRARWQPCKSMFLYDAKHSVARVAAHLAALRTTAAGPLLVKAGVWTLVEELHRRGSTKLYDGWPPTPQQVGAPQLESPTPLPATHALGGSGLHAALAACCMPCSATSRQFGPIGGVCPPAVPAGLPLAPRRRSTCW